MKLVIENILIENADIKTLLGSNCIYVDKIEYILDRTCKN